MTDLKPCPCGEATKRNYRNHFGSDAFVPGYCGKCPGAGMVGTDPVCKIYAEDSMPREIWPSGEPPDWCPIRHISERYAEQRTEGKP